LRIKYESDTFHDLSAIQTEEIINNGNRKVRSLKKKSK